MARPEARHTPCATHELELGRLDPVHVVCAAEVMQPQLDKVRRLHRQFQDRHLLLNHCRVRGGANARVQSGGGRARALARCRFPRSACTACEDDVRSGAVVPSSSSSHLSPAGSAASPAAAAGGGTAGPIMGSAAGSVAIGAGGSSIPEGERRMRGKGRGRGGGAKEGARERRAHSGGVAPQQTTVSASMFQPP